MKKRILSILLSLCMVLSLIPAGAVGIYAAAEPSTQTDTSHYFYNQLSDTAKIFYDGMVKMLTTGMFKTGTEALDLAEGNPLVVDLIKGFSTGAVDLLGEYGAGRDAFYADYPGVFYVDFSSLSIRVTQKGEEYHLYLGPGKYKTYYTEGFENKEQVEQAEADYNAALAALIAAGREKTLPQEQVEAVHDYLTKSVSYRDELNVSTPENMGFIRTAYGALVKHEGVCEAYTRAFKAAMDSLGIPCVMVSGVYRHNDNVNEAHIWNEVEIDGKWYGVDVTMDDPKNSKATGAAAGVDGYENHEYLLVGENKMNVHHYPDGVMSPGGFTFVYPSIGSEYIQITDDENPLKVRYRTEAHDSEILESGVYYVSYYGMNATEMRENGYYLILRNNVYDVDEGWQETDWYYFMPEIYGTTENFGDIGHETRFDFGWVEYVEFGVTNIPCPTFTPGTLVDQFFYGDTSLLLARSGMLHNENGTYRAAPASLRGEPAYNLTSISPGQDVHLKAYFNDILVTPDVYNEWCKDERVNDPGYKEALRSATAADFSLKCEVQDKFMGTVKSDDVYQNMRNLSISFTDKETVIEFDYTTSNMWIDDNVFYVFYISGLVGAYSGKTPGSFGWAVAAPCAICAYRSRGFDYNTFAKPVLVDDQDLSMDGWVDSEGNEWDGSQYEGTPWADMLRNRLMLVVEDSGTKDAHNMEEMVGGEGEEVLSALTYNINLTLCSKQWAELEDGMSIRIQLGFPEGYGPEDAGVTFKAYHFNKNTETGEILSIEEIPCTITPYGLLIECHSFSPFAIVAVEAPEQVDPAKNVVVVAGTGGSVNTDKNATTVTLNKGDSVTVTVTANEGYVIDSVLASNVTKTAEKTGETSATLTIGYDDISADALSSVVSATFVVAEVAEEEGETITFEAEAPAEFTVTSTAGTAAAVAENGTLVLRVENPNSAYTYNWYKQDSGMVGTGAALTINDVTADHAGSYYCVAIATAGATTAQTQSSNSVTVTVVPAQDVHTDHIFDGDWIADGDSGHFKQCSYVYSDGSCCPVRTEVSAHTYNDNGVCTVCGHVNESQHKHRYGDWTADGAEGHYQTCTFVYANGVHCTDMTGYSTHTYDDDGVCTVCGYTDDSQHKHRYDGWTAEGDTGHFKQCTFTYADGTVCPERTEAEPHSYNQDGKCEVCGYVNESAHTHRYDGWTSDGAEGHYQTCTYVYTNGTHCPERQNYSAHTYDDDGVCTVCGYTDDSQHKHIFGAYDNEGNAGHYQQCLHINSDGTRCSFRTDTEPHSFDGEMICTICGYKHDGTHDHTYGSEYFSDGILGHYTVCTFPGCGQRSVLSEHIYDVEGVCTVCGFRHDPAHTHSFDTVWHTDGVDGHYHLCTHINADGTQCGEKSPVEDHVYDVDGVCTACVFRHDPAHTHTFDEAWHDDGVNGHHHLCTHINADGTRCGEKSAVESHTYDTDGVCTVCGFVYDPAHTHTFDEAWHDDGVNGHYHLCTHINADGTQCGEKSPVEDHIYDVDGVCTVCGFLHDPSHTHTFGDEWHYTDAHGHYHLCTHVNADKSVCTERSEVFGHQYDRDGKCTVCGFTNESAHTHYVESSGQWYADGSNGHYQKCGHCGTMMDYAPHTYNYLGVCNICGYHRPASENPHTHSFAGFSFDNTQHWRFCMGCGLSIDYGAHQFINGVCTVCGYFDPNYSASLPVENSVVVETATEPTDQAPDDENVDVGETETPEPSPAPAPETNPPTGLALPLFAAAAAASVLVLAKRK